MIRNYAVIDYGKKITKKYTNIICAMPHCAVEGGFWLVLDT